MHQDRVEWSRLFTHGVCKRGEKNAIRITFLVTRRFIAAETNPFPLL